jgi:hypothetical protein
MIDDAGLDGVEVDIAYEGLEITIVLDEVGSVASLEEVADACMSPVELLAVVEVHCQHDLRERSGTALDGQMDVIRHEAVREHPESVASPALGETRKIESTIRIVSKDVPALVTTSDDVVKTSRHLDPRSTTHAVLSP